NRGTESSRGMRMRNHLGGRGNKVTKRQRHNEKRERCLPEARRLRRAGWSYPAIGDRFGVSGKTVWKWLNATPERVPFPHSKVKAIPAHSEGEAEGDLERGNPLISPSPAFPELGGRIPPLGLYLTTAEGNPFATPEAANSRSLPAADSGVERGGGSTGA